MDDKSWDRYWRGMQQGAAPAIGGANHPRFDQFWREFFSRLPDDPTKPNIIDLASGDGAVTGLALQALDTRTADITCIDVSHHAIERLQKRFPTVHGFAADASKIPLASESFDIVTSQFGVEYAGIDAFAEAARLVSPAGRLAMLIHMRDGSIDRECSASVSAVQKLRQCKFIPLSITMFETGFATCRGGDSRHHVAAVRALTPAYRTLEQTLKQYGRHVAGDTLLRLYQDVDRIRQSMQDYDQVEILQWLSAMDGELDVYISMMQSMRDAALSREQFEKVCDSLANSRFSLEAANSLAGDNHDRPLAWKLIAQKRRAT